jgi:hypothetical protein
MASFFWRDRDSLKPKKKYNSERRSNVSETSNENPT